MGFRELDSNDDYDIAQMSMKVFKDNKWYAKDGMKGNIKDWCGKRWTDEAETDVDWVNIPQNLEYDANLKTLTT